jgi:hypothetical protein
VPVAESEIPAEGFSSLRAERARTTAIALARDVNGLVVPVDIVEPDADQFAAAHAGVEQEPDDRGVAAVLEGVSFRGGKPLGQGVVIEDGHWFLGYDGAVMRSMGERVT